jgi:hypothetical protein
MLKVEPSVSVSAWLGDAVRLVTGDAAGIKL